MFIIIVFWLGCDRLSGLLFLVPTLLLSKLAPLSLPSLSVSLSCFILAVPMHKVWENTLVWVPFPAALLNGTFFFCKMRWTFGSKSRLSITKCNNNYKIWHMICSFVNGTSDLTSTRLMKSWTLMHWKFNGNI